MTLTRYFNTKRKQQSVSKSAEAVECVMKMKKKTAIIFAVTLTTALIPAAGLRQMRSGERNHDISAIISHTVVVGNSSGTIAENWNEMLEKLETAIQEGKGQNVNYLAGDSVVIPTDVLNRLAGKNATLALHMTDGLTFSISGSEIPRTDSPVQISLCGESDIPDEARNQLLEGVTISREFCMREKETYPCHINAHLSFGPQNAGRHAVLYFYDEFDGTMRQEEFCRIQESGNVIFGINRGDEYIVTVMKGYTVESGDVLSRIAAKNDISLKSLMAANPQITDSDKIREGQMINIPAR